MTVSTVGQPRSCVKVYDSLYNKLPFETKDQVAALMHTEENSIKLVYAGVQVCDGIYEVLNTHSSNSYYFFLYRNKQTNVTVEFLP